MARLNISQAARSWNIARSTLQRAIKNGTVSMRSDQNGGKYIDSSEMIRVYGGARQQRRDVARSGVGSSVDSSDTASKLQLLKVHYHYLKKENENLIKELEKRDKMIESQRDMLMIMHRQLPKKPAPKKTPDAVEFEIEI